MSSVAPYPCPMDPRTHGPETVRGRSGWAGSLPPVKRGLATPDRPQRAGRAVPAKTGDPLVRQLVRQTVVVRSDHSGDAVGDDHRHDRARAVALLPEALGHQDRAGRDT